MIPWKTEMDAVSHHTILIISQDVKMVAVCEPLFQQKNCTVVSEIMPHHALQAARLLLPSLIIMDRGLPHAERVSLCRELRAITRGTILCLIAGPGEEKILDLYCAGADECLTGPLNPMALLVKSMVWLVRQEWTELQPASTQQYV